ncbi:hypothetical protein JCM18899A_49520 [Nocardioides sp. AN3]
MLLRVHRPTNLEGAVPCLFAIHGGGFILGTYEVEDQRLDAWCQKLGVVGLSVDYRLAPESPYPAALGDCLAAFRWVTENASSLGVLRQSVGLLGTSAGAGLALAMGLYLRDSGAAISPAFQLLSYPMIDDRQITPSSSWTDVPVWDPASNDLGWRSYLGDLYGGDDVPEYAAPARGEDLRGLAPTFISVGSADIVHDEAVELARRLVHAGVPTDLRVYAGAPHGMDRRATDTYLSRSSRRDMLAWLTRCLTNLR